MDKDFRLPKTIKPTRYQLRLEVDLDEWQYQASEQIDISIAAPTSSIILHAVDLEIEAANVFVGDKIFSAEVTRHPEAEAIGLQLPENIPAGQAQIDFRFRGAILDRLTGFYRSEKEGFRYATTQFEPASARRAFPCFDEPEFKARFALSLIIPADTMAVSNGKLLEIVGLEDGRQEYRFKETPPISSYLVAFAVGPFETTETIATSSGVPVRVVLPPGLADKGVYARDAHASALTALETYTDIPYAYEKVDAIGVPDFEASAMENPGAIVYRLTAIATDPERASTSSLKNISYVAAHELTHMWWGDLVTMKWWNDLWLNESFATFVGYKITAELHPEWELWRDFVTTISKPFSLDALVSTHPISFEVKNALQATERFDIITYWKGAAVVRMLEGYLGEDVFRAGVRSYLAAYRDANATADDFWNELDRVSDQDVTTIANAWIKEAGHPLVRAMAGQSEDGLHLSLQQERFFADPDASAKTQTQLWPIPLVIKFGHGERLEEKRILFSERTTEVVLPNASWYFLNGEASGFYRFLTDEDSLRALTAVLSTVLKPHERLALLDNQWTLLKAGVISVEQYIALLEGYHHEHDRAVLTVVAEQLDWLGTHVVSASVRTRFEQFVRDFFSSHHETLGWEPLNDESVDVRMKRAIVLHALGDVANDATIQDEARHRLEHHLSDSSSLDPNLASTITRLAAKRGDGTLHDRYLEKKRAAKTDPEEEIRFLMALAAFEHPELMARSLDLAMSREVRTQDRPLLLAAMLSRRHSRDLTWQRLRESWAELESELDPALLQKLITALGHLTHEPIANEVREFIATRANEATRETISQVDERLRLDAATVRRLQKDIEQQFS